MLFRFFCAAVILCLAADFAGAQDPTKVASKNYKLHFENDRVQVIDVHYGPHEKSAMHQHPPGVVVNLTAGHLRFTDENGKVQEVYSLAGETRWFGAVTHTVENIGDNPFNAVYIGIKGKSTTAASDRKQDAPLVGEKMNDEEMSGQKLSGEQLAKILADYFQNSAQSKAQP